jgi:hypothetical protein
MSWRLSPGWPGRVTGPAAGTCPPGPATRACPRSSRCRMRADRPCPCQSETSGSSARSPMSCGWRAAPGARPDPRTAAGAAPPAAGRRRPAAPWGLDRCDPGIPAGRHRVADSRAGPGYPRPGLRRRGDDPVQPRRPRLPARQAPRFTGTSYARPGTASPAAARPCGCPACEHDDGAAGRALDTPSTAWPMTWSVTATAISAGCASPTCERPRCGELTGPSPGWRRR